MLMLPIAIFLAKITGKNFRGHGRIGPLNVLVCVL